ncbi:distal membrane-arm assembly complex protein 2 [Teleopsis dalmanni]|uniref:distal membrane-arm assembly complex protein 2 n=1 Tax=Teleopsis dalmanni TaxID=139649 RepID=UPI0018CCBBDF|nr:distal membrane-arm assembly complex protein 2 [Teleopsis dalmanni]
MLKNLKSVLVIGAKASQIRCTSVIRNYSQADQHNIKDSNIERLKRELETDKVALKWRTPVGEDPKDWTSKMALFSNKESNSDFIIMMQNPINWTPKAIKAWWQKRNVFVERHMQQYVPLRHEILGSDLAVAHFILFRGGTVKFTHSPNWMRANKDQEFDLPNKFDPLYKIEALRCDNMTLYYEGLENIRCLNSLKLLSFRNVKTFDDWCLDRVSGGIYPQLETLDISGTQITARGLSCLYRLSSLKLLIVSNRNESIEFELTCAMLEEALPNITIANSDEEQKRVKE